MVQSRLQTTDVDLRGIKDVLDFLSRLEIFGRRKLILKTFTSSKRFRTGYPVSLDDCLCSTLLLSTYLEGLLVAQRFILSQ